VSACPNPLCPNSACPSKIIPHFSERYRSTQNPKKVLPKYDYSPLIAKIIISRRPALLLCAGHSIIDEKALSTIKNASQNTSSVTIVETSSASGKAESYRICAGKVLMMGNQFFAEREDRTEETVGELEQAVTQRQFDFDKQSALHNHRAFLLVCGELGVVSGRKNPEYHKLVKQATKLRDALRDAKIILNPTHTRMGNGGTLNAKRKFLSSNKRIYLSSSNWNNEQKISRTLHTLWYDGKPRKHCKESSDPEHFCYREWSLPG
jgi:hypothetical protein